jgi:hypothetical protein
LFLVFCGCFATVEQNQFGSRVLSTSLQGGFTPNESLEMYESIGEFLRRGRIDETGDHYHYSTERFDIEINPVKVPLTIDNALDAKRPNWLARCNTDSITDQTTCLMNIMPQRAGKGGLFQTVDRQGNILSSCIMNHDFPGRRGIIRVDSNSPITTNSAGCISGASARLLQRQLLVGSRLQTRRVEWPYNSSQDKEILISGGYESARNLYRFSASADLASLFSNVGQ